VKTLYIQRKKEGTVVKLSLKML